MRNSLPAPDRIPFIQIKGAIVRKIRFRSQFNENGHTGWKFSNVRDPLSSSPKFSTKLNWNWTLIKSATSFDN